MVTIHYDNILKSLQINYNITTNKCCIIVKKIVYNLNKKYPVMLNFYYLHTSV